MKTSLDIPVEILAEAIQRTGATTKREAVVTVMTDWLRQARLRELVAELGTFDDVMTLDELSRLRLTP
jgi:Arc/MetJ family transcription regulator